MRQLIPAILGGVMLSACANPGTPPGAPERHTPPKILSIVPDTNALNIKAREVKVTFDAVVSERPGASGATELKDLVTVSPRQGDLEVGWHRDNITIRPRRGWAPNTTYTVTILPGIADLQGNVQKAPTELVFSTGNALDSGRIRGTVFDWLQGKPVIGAVVEAVPRPDSTLVYTTRTDSTGDFSLRLPTNATYTIRTSINTSKERVFDSRMAYDSLPMSLQDTGRVELLAYTHDTAGPQIGVVRPEDTITARAVFSGAIDPTVPLQVSQFSLTTKDGTPVTIVSVTPATLIPPDTLKNPLGAPTAPKAQDSTARPPQGVAAAQAALDRVRTQLNGSNAPRNTQDTVVVKKPSKPLLFRDVVIKVAVALHPKTEYILRATNIRSPNGVTANSEKTFVTSEPPPPPKASKDSVVQNRP